MQSPATSGFEPGQDRRRLRFASSVYHRNINSIALISDRMMPCTRISKHGKRVVSYNEIRVEEATVAIADKKRRGYEGASAETKLTYVLSLPRQDNTSVTCIMLR